jgi:hypothetical protein
MFDNKLCLWFKIDAFKHNFVSPIDSYTTLMLLWVELKLTFIFF